MSSSTTSGGPGARRAARSLGLKRLSKDLHAKGVFFVGIDVKDNDASAVAFQREFDIK